MLTVEEELARSPARPLLPYLEVDKENLKVKFTSIPERPKIPLKINEALIMDTIQGTSKVFLSPIFSLNVLCP